MKVIIVLFILSVMSFLPANAVDNVTHIALWDNDGSKVSYALSDNPEITFDSIDLILNLENMKINFPLNNLRQITYENQTSGINNLASDGIDLMLTNDLVKITNLKRGCKIILFSANGGTIFNTVMDSDGEYNLAMSDLNSGVYFIKVNNVVHKIFVK